MARWKEEQLIPLEGAEQGLARSWHLNQEIKDECVCQGYREGAIPDRENMDKCSEVPDIQEYPLVQEPVQHLHMVGANKGEFEVPCCGVALDLVFNGKSEVFKQVRFQFQKHLSDRNVEGNCKKIRDRDPSCEIVATMQVSNDVDLG